MLHMIHTLTLSLPTFAELTERIGRNGLTEFLQEDGSLLIGDLKISSSSEVLQSARLAAGIAERVEHPDDPGLIYQDQEWELRRRCSPEGIELETKHRSSGAEDVGFIPRNAIALAAAELIDCLSRKE